MSWFSKNKSEGFVDKVKDKRIGLLYIQHDNDDDTYNITAYDRNYNLIYEIREVFCDKILSKVEIVNIPYNKCRRGRRVTNKFNPWVRGSNIHWLSPPIDVDRDNKLNDLLEK